MSEKRWTDDERSEAFERGLKTMEGVALELYRRGREPLLEELEEARARNADMRAMLEQVTRERDEWRDKFLALNQTAGELCNACGWAFRIPGESCRCEVVKERDEARADAERYLADLRRCASEPYERTRELEALQAEVERLRVELIRAGSRECDIAACNCGTWHHQNPRAAYRRGAEAMREACQQWCRAWENDGEAIADALADLRVEE